MRDMLSGVTHSLMVRLVSLLAVLGGLVGASLVVSWLVSQSTEIKMVTLSDERIPELLAGSEVVAATDQTRALLTATLAVITVSTQFLPSQN